MSEVAWAQWPIEPPLEAAYVDWENLTIGVSGKAPPQFWVPSISQSRSTSERLAKLNAAERLFLLVRELRLSRTLRLGACIPEGKLKEALEGLLLSERPAAHWRFSDGGQGFFFKLPMSLLAPLCPELTKAMAELSSVSAEEILATQGETKVLWVVPPQGVELEPCLFPVLYSEDQKWFWDPAAAGYSVVWSAKSPAKTPQATPSKKGVSSTSQDARIWAVQAKKREDCGFELGNEVAAELDLKLQAKQLEKRMVVGRHGKAK